MDSSTSVAFAHTTTVDQWCFIYVNVLFDRQRNGWGHRDVIRLSHPKPNSERGSPGLGCVIKYVVKGLDAAKESYLAEDASKTIKKIITYLEATEDAKKLSVNDVDKACEMILKHR
jgi:60 kDa SS-A/Ro ribonucleoprotein